MLADELDKLMQTLDRLHRPVSTWLRPGIDRASVESLFGTKVPDAVTTWFGWCNGVDGPRVQLQDDASIIPGYMPMSIDEAVRAMPEYMGDPILGDHWVPLLTNAFADIYAATWNQGGVHVAQVLLGEETEVEFASIEQMVHVFNACYAHGGFYVDDERTLVQNPVKYREIYQHIVGTGTEAQR